MRAPIFTLFLFWFLLFLLLLFFFFFLCFFFPRGARALRSFLQVDCASLALSRLRPKGPGRRGPAWDGGPPRIGRLAVRASGGSRCVHGGVHPLTLPH